MIDDNNTPETENQVEENVETTDARINPNLDPDHAKADDQASEIDPDFVESEEEIVEEEDESEDDVNGANDEA
jgi:hypothetical protein